jgi:hypothetical protein
MVEQVLPKSGGRGESQTMYIHVSKYKNDKIKKMQALTAVRALVSNVILSSVIQFHPSSRLLIQRPYLKTN